MRKSDIDYEVGSDNVFADMGLPNPEERLVKARLAQLINKAVEKRGWTQQYAAKVLGITQPKVSAVSRGRLKNFSVERLMAFLDKLDYRVTITVSSKEDLPSEEIVVAARQRIEGHAAVK